MTILYKVQNGEGSKDGAGAKSVLCRISSKNIVAYCVSLRMETQIFVCDMQTPWKYFKVCASKSVVTVLDWNYTGSYLLVGYKGGNVELWTTRLQLLNSWQLLYRANFPSEDIIDTKFFHNGKSVFFHTPKKDLPQYADKFERLEHRATLAHFGGAAVDGCIIVTASGLLGAFIIPKLAPMQQGENLQAALQSVDLCVGTHSLGLSRSFITSCCLAHCPSGGLKVAVNCGWREQLVHCFKVSVNLEHDETVGIKCESLASIFLNPVSESRKLTQLRWFTVNSEDSILVSYNGVEGGLLEQWTLVKKHQSVHKLLQKNKGDFIQSESWENIAKLHFTAEICEIVLSKLLSDNLQIFVVLRDNSVQLLEAGLKKQSVTMFERLADERQANCKFVTADSTLMNQVLLIFDNHCQMYAMQVVNPHIDKSFKMNAISLQVALLEYCIITGIDASDILLLNLPNLDLLIEKLTENFTRQPAFTRHFYYSNFLSLKSNMCRVQSRQHDFDNLILLHSISITFKSLLRPSDLGTSLDKGPADHLAMILSEPLPDVDKVLLNLDAKDFTVEPVTLQSLQQLIQWVADLALTILNKLPDELMKSKLSKKQGYDISRDIIAIGSIRELLVMIRIWGLLNPQCLPIYTKSVDNLDVLSILFRLLTRLAQNTNEPDEMLLDECSTLSTQVLIPQRLFHNPTSLLNSHMSMMKSLPLIFTTAVEPVGLQDMQVDEVVFANSTKDGVSNLHLGSRVHPIRRCARCGFVNSVHKVAKTSALKAWCNRWIYCHCGGGFVMDSN